MKVVVVHNYYDSRVPSGENAAVDDELDLLRAAGVEVIPLVSSSDKLLASKWEAVKASGAPLWSPTSRHLLKERLRSARPDVVHVHNLFPRPGPSIIAAAQAAGVPVVQTVHNRRISCVSATHFRDGHPCTDCVGRRVQWPGAAHACYRGSRLQSVLMATSNTVHHNALRGLAHYFAVSESIAEVLVRSGVPTERVSVKPNPVPDPGVEPFLPQRRVLYAGRLEETKGAALLLEAWLSLDPPQRPRLRVCGAGPLEDRFIAAARANPDLEFEGRQDSAQMRAHVAASTSICIPSIAGEGLPRILAEAFAAGRPVLATHHEPIASAVGDDRGWLFAPEASELAARIALIASAPPVVLEASSSAARRYYDDHFAPGTVVATQLEHYRRVAQRSRT